MIEKKYRDFYVSDPERDGARKGFLNVRYKGEHYLWTASERNWRIAKICCFLESIGVLALFFMAGMLNNEGSRKLYVMLPYLLLFLPAVYQLLGAASFMFQKKKLTYPQFDGSVLRMKRSSMGVLAAAFLSMALELVFMIRNLSLNLLDREIYFLLLHLLIIAAEVGFLFMHRNFFCELHRKEENEEFE